MKEDTKITPTQAEAIHSDKLALVIWNRCFARDERGDRPESFGAVKAVKMQRNMSDNPVLKRSANKILRRRGFIDVKLSSAVAIGLCLLTTGCGAVFGVKDVDFWGAKMSFYAGTDLHVGANGISRVDDSRGVGSYEDDEENRPVIRNAGGAIYKEKR